MNCPVCKSPTLDALKPFCSKRCADIDLGRWFRETYVIEGEDLDADDGVLPPNDPAEDRPK